MGETAVRLDKAVALAGISRGDARRALADGRVTVNGRAERDAGFHVSAADVVALDGEAVSLREHVHIMLNKPAGCLTATEDAHGAPTVMDLLPDRLRLRKIGPVGRLDKDVTGLVLLTTDGQLAHRLISPRRDVEKVYFARVEGRLDEDCARAFEKGIAFRDFTALPARLKIVRAGEDASEARVYVKEGKFHQVKRMCLAVGHPVLSLRREKIGPVSLDPSLAEGEWRTLTAEEETILYDISGMNQP